MPNCSSCLIPAAVPGVALNEKGICNHCRDFAKVDPAKAATLRTLREIDLNNALSTAKKSDGKYHALVCLSGGKDSIALLYKLKVEYGLSVLAYTTDMNVPDVAWDNIRRTVTKLDVDHVTFRPPQEFYRKFYRFLLQNQEERGAVRTVCYVCAPLFEGYALQTATEQGIPLVLAGYSPGQPDPERMEYEFAEDLIAETDWTPPELIESGLFSDSELARFWNPFRYPEGTKFPRYLAPFHAWEYNQQENMELVVKLGLVKDTRAASPIESNCPLNWLLMYSDLKNLGYNPYAPEFSGLIREGKASKTYWKFMMPLINAMIKHKFGLGKNIDAHLKQLGLRTDDLRINRTKQPAWKPANSVVDGMVCK